MRFKSKGTSLFHFLGFVQVNYFFLCFYKCHCVWIYSLIFILIFILVFIVFASVSELLSKSSTSRSANTFSHHFPGRVGSRLIHSLLQLNAHYKYLQTYSLGVGIFL